MGKCFPKPSTSIWFSSFVVSDANGKFVSRKTKAYLQLGEDAFRHVELFNTTTNRGTGESDESDDDDDGKSGRWWSIHIGSLRRARNFPCATWRSGFWYLPKRPKRGIWDFWSVHHLPSTTYRQHLLSGAGSKLDRKKPIDWKYQWSKRIVNSIQWNKY